MDPACRIAGITLALALTACASVERGRPRLPPTTVAAEKLDRPTSLALGEWARWGAQWVGAGADGTPCLVHADGSCTAVDDGCGQEQTAGLCPVVEGYWQDTPPFTPRHDCTVTDVCTATWPEAALQPRLQTRAWSAVFITALMRRAGFTAAEFHPSATHAHYVVAAREGYATAFQVMPTPAHAQPGDLVCMLRGMAARSGMTVADLRDGPGAPQMHCEVVVAVDLAARTLDAIGGNVQQTVARTVVPLDAEGRVPWLPDAKRSWLLVMQARRAGNWGDDGPLRARSAASASPSCKSRVP